MAAADIPAALTSFDHAPADFPYQFPDHLPRYGTRSTPVKNILGDHPLFVEPVPSKGKIIPGRALCKACPTGTLSGWMFIFYGTRSTPDKIFRVPPLWNPFHFLDRIIPTLIWLVNCFLLFTSSLLWKIYKCTCPRLLGRRICVFKNILKQI